jgi:hypothetical protein
MTESLTFDPELEGLLREIAADPGSRLLRLPRASRPQDLLAIPEPVTRARAGLSLAERHLIEVHRDELAQLLRSACLIRFFRDPQKSVSLNSCAVAGLSILVEDPDEWRSRSQKTLSDIRQSSNTLGGLELIESCLQGDQLDDVTVTQLAQASLIFQPSDTAEAYVGLDLVLAGNTTPAINMMETLLSGTMSSLVRSCVLENLALAYSSKNDIITARSAYYQAIHACPNRPSAYVGWLLTALQSASRQASLRASRTVDEECRGSPYVVSDLASRYQRQRASGILTVTDEAKDLVESIIDRIGPLSWEVANALLR